MKFALLALLAAGSLAAADLGSFNGTWIVASAEMNGDAVPGDSVSSIVLTLKDGAYQFASNEGNTRGRFTVDFSKTPAAMDVIEEEGPNVGRKMPGIAELTPDGWRATYAFQGDERPKEFKTSSGDGFFLAVYHRKPGSTQASTPALRILLVTGGCCHDYARHKDILKTGLEARLNAKVDVVYSPDGSTRPPLAIYGHPDYAKGYDLVIHDECAADINDPVLVAGVLQPHRDGLPAVNLHCAIHSYRIGDPNDPAKPGTPHAFWFDFLGLQSSGHGAQKPITVTYLDPEHPTTRGMANWTTIPEELYNNIQVWGSTKPLARGRQDAGDQPGQNDTTVVWTHEYGPKKTRVFSTSLGHNNETVADPRYLDLVTHGILWATGHLSADGTPAPGYLIGK